MQRFEELLSAYLEGQLSGRELDELAELVRSEAVLRKKFTAAAEMEGILRGHFTTAGNETTTARILAALPVESRDKQAVSNVMARIDTVTPAHNAEQELSAARGWYIRAAAAVFVLAAGTVAFYAWQNAGRQPYNLAQLGAIAAIQNRSGTVMLIREMTDDKEPLPANFALTGRDGLETQNGGSVAIRYIDGTTLELWSPTVARIQLRKSSALDPVNRENSLGKRVTLEVGSIEINAAKQPADKPFIVITTDGETQVVGTRFRVGITPAGTRVDVFEGRVQLTRRSDLKTVDLSAKQFAILSANVPLKAEPSDAIPRPEPKAVDTPAP